MKTLSHFRGVRFRPGVIHFGQTDTDILVDKAFFKGALAVAKINTVIGWRRMVRRSRSGTMAFAPQNPGPWYNARYAARLAGLKLISEPEHADIVFVFDDNTVSEAGMLFREQPSLNARISDISKTHVAAIFHQVFGYAVAVDPLTYQGRAVQKSDANATHDGKIVDCPLREAALVEGCVYQKLIDSTPSEIQSEEMRVAIVGDEIPVVFHKFKDLDKRFGTDYARVDVRLAEDVFSSSEIDMLIKFCGAMGLDFGAIDVFRDKHDGRIYVVDVNKTCMPVLSLPLRKQMQSLDKIASSLRRYITRLTSA